MHKYFGEIATLKLLTFLGLGTLAAMAVTPIQAQTIYWTSWTSGSTAVGSITTPTTTLGVTYNNPQGIGFAQYTGSGGIDYWTNSAGIRNPARSPYTSATVANIPTGTDIIALRFAGQQSLTFSVAIANPVFSYVSLNGNGYAFDRDFNILSFGDGTVRDAGYWGAGSSTKQIVDIGGGVLEYRLIGGGEPHGTLQFLGSFNTVSWRSLTNEYWNRFTVGIQETASVVFGPTPEPSVTVTIGAMVVAGVGFMLNRRRRYIQ